MMSREYCEKCKKALKGCICSFTSPVNNQTPVTILRHTSETKSIKGTVPLLLLSLSNIELIDGEVFDSKSILKDNYENILIFPSSTSIHLKDYKTIQNLDSKKHFIFIDGTWKKAYKILQLNPYLKTIIHLNIDVHLKSPYSEIRKQKTGGFSTLEAVIGTLKEFEKDVEYSGIEQSFKDFVRYIKNLSN